MLRGFLTGLRSLESVIALSPAPPAAVAVTPLVVAAGVAATLYASAVLALLIAGRRGDAAALARFVPDCVVLVRRLLGDARVPRRARLALALLLYLVSPIDLVADFVPVAGQLDDAILLALVLGWLLRSGGPTIVAVHWPGRERSLAIVLRAAQSPGGWRTT